MDTFNIISSIAALISTVISAIALIYSCRSNIIARKNEKKSATIDSYRILQEEVLDKLVNYRKKDSETIINNAGENEDCKAAYNDARALLSRCECFSVAVLEDIYDFDLLCEISGCHLWDVYKKVQPIIEFARKRAKNNKPYKSFEILCDKIHDKEAK